MKYDLIVVGMGPSAVFLAYELIELNNYKNVLLIDQGKPVEKRNCPMEKLGKCVHCKPYCNITCGFSGAGAFSDGKLSLSPDVGGNLPEILGYDVATSLIHESDEIYLKFGADTSVYGVDKEAEIREIRRKAINANLKLVECPIRHLGTEEGYKIDFDDLERKAAEASMLLLCSPHNPVGRVWTEDELNRLFDICKKHSLYIVSDEIHCDFILEGKHHSMLEIAKGYDRLIVCTAPSKTFNIAGLSNSNIIVPDKETREKLQKVYRRDSIGGHNPLSMAATIAAYKYCAGWVDELNTYLKDNRDYAIERLSEHSIDAVRIEGTYLLWVDLSRYSDQPAALLKEHGLIVNEGSTFGNNGKGFVRFNLGCPREGLKKALDRLFEALAQ